MIIHVPVWTPPFNDHEIYLFRTGMNGPEEVNSYSRSIPIPSVSHGFGLVYFIIPYELCLQAFLCRSLRISC
jgi:hypothetical protein